MLRSSRQCFNYNPPFLPPKANKFTTQHFYLQKLINLLWQKYIRQFLNGPNVTRPDCKTPTQTVTASLQRYGLLSEASLALKKCLVLTTDFIHTSCRSVSALCLGL